MHSNMLYENSFAWYSNLDPKNGINIAGCIQPSSRNINPTILNLVTIAIQTSIMTPEINRDFQILDKIKVLDNMWYINSISEVHPVIVESTKSTVLHKTLMVTRIPKTQYKFKHLSSLFSRKREQSTLTVIQKHLALKSKDITLIEQFETTVVEPNHFILISLDEIDYTKHRGYNRDTALGVAKIGFRAVGEKAHTVLKTFHMELMSAKHEISEVINDSLKRNGVDSPGLFQAIETLEIEEFRMLDGYNPETVLKMGMWLPYIEDYEESLSLPVLSVEIEMRLKIYEKIRSRNVKVQTPVS